MVTGQAGSRAQPGAFQPRNGAPAEGTAVSWTTVPSSNWPEHSEISHSSPAGALTTEPLPSRETSSSRGLKLALIVGLTARFGEHHSAESHTGSPQLTRRPPGVGTATSVTRQPAGTKIAPVHTSCAAVQLTASCRRLAPGRAEIVARIVPGPPIRTLSSTYAGLPPARFDAADAWVQLPRLPTRAAKTSSRLHSVAWQFGTKDTITI